MLKRAVPGHSKLAEWVLIYTDEIDEEILNYFLSAPLKLFLSVLLAVPYMDWM